MILDRTEEFSLVQELRSAVSKFSHSLRESTVTEYQKIYERMLRNGTTVQDAASRSAYYRQRAALLYVSSLQAREALKQRDKSPYLSQQWESAMSECRRLAEIFRQFPPDPERVHHASEPTALRWSDVAREKKEQGWTPKCGSKKKGIGALLQKENWGDVLLSYVSDSYKAAYAVAFLTGARPAEIEQGVQVRLRPDSLEITISGAKIGEHRGQPERTLLVANDSEAARFLASLCKGDTVCVTTSAKRFCDAVRSASKRAFPKMRTVVSPYTLRHAVACGLKSSGVDVDGIAQVLGHRASRSQQAYGNACHQGTVSILGVRATYGVKQTARNPASACQISGPKLG